MCLEDALKKIYYDPEHSASFSSIHKLLLAVREQYPLATEEQVREWLSKQKAYTLHKVKRRTFVRNPVVADAVDNTWQADLVDMQAFKRHNQGNGYILTAVDVLSKFAFAVPIKTKHAKNVKEAFETIFKDRYPSNLQTDQGKEFLNSEVQELFKSYNINHYTTTDADIKCSIVERFHRTLRGRMFRYFSSKGHHKYLEVLPKLVNSYNHTVHSATGTKPADVDARNEAQVFEKLYGFKSKREMLLLNRKKKQKIIPEKTTVRIKYHEEPFDKGYYPNWTDEIFRVSKPIKGINKPMYSLEDENKEKIIGKFYPEELQPVADTSYRIKILKTRTRQGRKEYFVKWINHPNSANTWIPESDLVPLDG